MARPAITEKFNVVILYERLACVGRAMAAYLRLTQELTDGFAHDYRIWRMDVALTPGRLAAEAERDIAAAEVIILAVDGHQPFPPAFQRLTREAGQDGGPPACAIIALLEESGEPVPPAGSWRSVLSGAATQIHAGVFVIDPPSSREDGIMRVQSLPASR